MEGEWWSFVLKTHEFTQVHKGVNEPRQAGSKEYDRSAVDNERYSAL